jgi:tetratricopeptide (TPR) repeat protein
MRFFLLTMLSLALVCVPAIGEEFSWSWDETQASGTAETNAAEKKAETVEPKVGEAAAVPAAADQQQAVEKSGKTAFKWSWDEDEGPVTAAEGKAEKSEPAGAGVPGAKTGAETAPAVESAPPVTGKPEVEPKSAEAAPVLPVEAEPQPSVTPAEPETRMESVSKGPVVPPGEKKLVASRIDAAEYDDLVKENLDLRRKIEDTVRDKESVSRENQNLSRQVQELSGKIEEAVVKIKEIRKEQGAGKEGTARAAELEAKLGQVEAEKNGLAASLAAMQAKLAEMKSSEKGGGPTATARPGSDLFKELEKENAALKEELRKLDANRNDVVKVQDDMLKKVDSAKQEVQLATEKERELQDKLAEARTAEKENKKKVAKLLGQMPSMEKEMAKMKTALADKDARLEASKSDVESLKEEIQNRDRRLKKVVLIGEMLDKARSDVGKISNKEKRDMHYNMAVVYAKEGKYHEAEKEYLYALRVDPTDADVHYNLAILYDNELRNKAKAAMHYSAYLKINPYAKDADAVKNWLMELEIDQK